jgi:hypothetical protein
MNAHTLTDGTSVGLATGHAAPGKPALGQHVGTFPLWLRRDDGEWFAFSRTRSQFQVWQWIQICDTWAEVCDALDIPESDR